MCEALCCGIKMISRSQEETGLPACKALFLPESPPLCLLSRKCEKAAQGRAHSEHPGTTAKLLQFLSHSRLFQELASLIVLPQDGDRGVQRTQAETQGKVCSRYRGLGRGQRAEIVRIVLG